MTNIRRIGVDEVGRGPLAGPVTVCAFAVSKKFNMSFLRGINDSKKLTQKSREMWSQKIHQAKKDGTLEFAISSVSAGVIDKKGISKSIQTAVNRSLSKLKLNVKESRLYLDGSLKAPEKFIKQKTIIKGDSKNKLISAASVVAKVHRDALMVRLSKKYPKYKFEMHKGYGTLMHRKSIKKHGVCEEHRWCFLTKLIKN